MRFKLFFNEASESLDISCLADEHTDIILPEDPSQHVYFPIPNNMAKDIRKELSLLIDESSAQEYLEIQSDIKALNDKKRDLINSLRVSINPKIIEKCKEFKEANAENFI